MIAEVERGEDYLKEEYERVLKDEAISAELEKSFRKQGITAFTGAKVTSARSSGDGVDLDATLADGTTKKIHADYLLVATGRTPNSDTLNLLATGVRTDDRGFIEREAILKALEKTRYNKTAAAKLLGLSELLKLP